MGADGLFKKLGIILVIIMISLAVPVACVDNEPDRPKRAEQVKVCELFPSVLHAPQYLAMNQGLFAEEGLEVEIITVDSKEELMLALQEEEADIGLAGGEISIMNYGAGQEDYLVNFSQLTQREGSFLLGHQPVDRFQWDNLRGKKIIVEAGRERQQMLLEYIILQHGLKPGEDVEVVDDPDAAQVFLAGRGDYVALGEPGVTWLMKAGVGYPQASLGTYSDFIADTVFMVRKSVLSNNSEMVQKFSNAIYQAQQWMDSHSPDETAQVIAPCLPWIEAHDLAEAVGRYQVQNTWRVTTVMDEGSFDLLQEIMVGSGRLESKIESSLLINNYFARKAVLTTQDQPY
ncbi:MAG: ABC transporter substrate-binding protein [Syntrophomonadaceae bacterium]|jgi:NitT/TauT family transport system substrate-binding protein|nr:ABC transporter substrate-binding protein [Syntrophomonadaceae bacterium]